MKEAEVADMLAEVLADASAEGGPVSRVDTFAEQGLMTKNTGIVILMEDGSEFQVTIVRSVEGDGDDSEDDDPETQYPTDRD